MTSSEPTSLPLRDATAEALLPATRIIAAAGAANLAVHGIALAAGASMTVDPAIGRPGHVIGAGAELSPA